MKDNVSGDYSRIYIMKHLFLPLSVHDHLHIQFGFLVMGNPKQLLASKDLKNSDLYQHMVSNTSPIHTAFIINISTATIINAKITATSYFSN